MEETKMENKIFPGLQILNTSLQEENIVDAKPPCAKVCEEACKSCGVLAANVHADCSVSGVFIS